MGFLPSRRASVATLFLSAFGWLGCNAIAGIQEGQLAASQDSGGPTDGTVPEGGGHGDGGGGDAPTGTDGSTGPDGAQDGTTGEAAPPPPVPLVCSIDPNTQTLVDDLSTVDGGADLSFQHALWVAPTTQTDAVYVLTQRSDDDSQFRGYEVNLDNGQVNLATWSGLDTSGNGGVQLLDVTTTTNGGAIDNQALTSYPAGVSGAGTITGLQVVQLPDQFGGLGGSAVEIGTVGPESVGSGRMTPMTSGATGWLASTQGHSFLSYALVVGSGEEGEGGIGSDTLATSTTNNFNFSAEQPFFDIDGNLYTFQSPSGAIGTQVYAVPDDFSDGGVESTVGTPDAGGAIFAAQISAADPTKVFLVGVTLAQSGQGAQLYVAQVPPSQLGSLYIGPPQFTAGSPLLITDFPTDNGGHAWSGDDSAFVGTPASGGSGMVLLLIGANGTQLTKPGTGLVENDGNQVEIAAVQFKSNFNETIGGTLYVSWIEHAAVDGSALKYDRIYAAKVTCIPSPGGG